MTRTTSALIPKTALLTFICIMICFSSATFACTSGCATGEITPDERPLLWKVNNGPFDNEKRLFWVPPNDPEIQNKYGYVILTKPITSPEFKNKPTRYCFGLNEKGLSVVYTKVLPAAPEDKVHGFRRILLDIIQTFGNIAEVKTYIEQNHSNKHGAQGNYTVMDGNGEIISFEISVKSNKVVSYKFYDPKSENRKSQDLYGFIVRGNELHRKNNSMDDTTIGGRYLSGTYNVLGMLNGAVNTLTPLQLLQGTGIIPDNCDEFIRYGAGEPTPTDDNRKYRSIAYRKTTAASIIQGVHADEDPLFTTMWSIFGNSNYSIAVPVWVTVEDIPEILNFKDFNSRKKPHNLYICSKRLTHIVTNFHSKNTLKENQTNKFFKLEESIQKTIFPFEERLLDRVNNSLMPTWKKEGATQSVIKDMARVENQIADDAYNVLNYFNNYFYLNPLKKAQNPTVKSIIDNAKQYPDPESTIFRCYNDKKFTCDIQKGPTPRKIHDAPDVIIKKTQTGQGYDVQFQATVTDRVPEKGQVSVHWNFGDESLPHNSASLNPLHTFKGPGKYLVSCTATDGNGMSDTDWVYVTIGGLIGQWDFNQRLAEDSGKASIGEDLILSPATAIVKSDLSGIAKYDKKVTVGTGDYFEMNVGAGPIDEWTFVFDVYHEGLNTALIQTNAENKYSTDFWIGLEGKINLQQSKGNSIRVQWKIEKSQNSIPRGSWARVVLSMDKTNKRYAFYLNGNLEFEKTVLNENVLKKFSLKEKVLLLADDNGEDQSAHISMVAFFNKALSSTEVLELGAPGDKI